MRGRRDRWLDQLAEFVERERGNFAAPLWYALYDQLLADGMNGRTAYAVALRCCRLAVMLLDGAEQRGAADALSVSERTAKYDAERLRRVIESGMFDEPTIRAPIRLPRRPDDRVRMPVRTRRRG